MENDLEKANRLCKELAVTLDTKYDKGGKLDDECDASVIATSKELMTLPLEAVLFALRTELQLERCIKYNLDEHEEFGLVLAKANGTREENKVENEQA